MATSVCAKRPRPKAKNPVKLLPALEPVTVPAFSSALLNGSLADARLSGAVIRLERQRTILAASLLTIEVADPDSEVMRSPLLEGRIDLDLDRDGREGGQWVYDRNRSIGGYSWTRDRLTVRFWDIGSATLKEINDPRTWDGEKTSLEALVGSLCREANKTVKGLALRAVVPNPDQLLGPVTPVVRRVVKGSSAQRERDSRPADNSGFANSSPSISFYGQRATRSQLHNIDIALTAAADLKASTAAAMALCMACCQEPATRAGGKAPFTNPPFGHSTSVGILQLLDIHYGGSVKARMNVQRVCRQFLTSGFTGNGGAIKIARHNPGIAASDIAAKVQGNQRGAVDYAPHRERAQMVMRAWQAATGRSLWNIGGGKIPRPSAGGTRSTRTTTTTTDTTKTLKRLHRPTQWRRGSARVPESSWTMLGPDRYGKSFGRRRFVSGDRLVFADDDSLIFAAPHQTLATTDPNLVEPPTIDIDGPGGLETLSFTVLAAAWVTPPGGVVDIQGAGPGDGPWIVATLTDSTDAPTIAVELTQPATEDPDKQTQTIRTKTVGTGGKDDGSTASGDSASARVYSAALYISQKTPGYVYGGGHGPALTRALASKGLDCSSSTALALKLGGIYKGTTAIVSGAFASSYGVRGEGKHLTVWANSGHVFLEMKGLGKYRRLDTGGGDGPKVHTDMRSTGGFTPRHWPGT